jgi:hypothetical protein
MTEAWNCYMLVAKSGNAVVLAPLERLAHQATAAQQLELAALYRSPPFLNEEKALEWIEVANESGNADAAKQLASFKTAADKKKVLLRPSLFLSSIKTPTQGTPGHTTIPHHAGDPELLELVRQANAVQPEDRDLARPIIS